MYRLTALLSTPLHKDAKCKELPISNFSTRNTRHRHRQNTLQAPSSYSQATRITLHSFPFPNSPRIPIPILPPTPPSTSATPSTAHPPSPSPRPRGRNAPRPAHGPAAPAATRRAAPACRAVGDRSDRRCRRGVSAAPGARRKRISNRSCHSFRTQSAKREREG